MSDFFHLLRFYRRLVGNQLYVLLLLMLAAVGSEGLGLGLFLPILQGYRNDTAVTHAVRRGFATLGIEYTLPALLGILVLFFLLRAVFLTAQASLVGHMMSKLLKDLRCRVAEQIFNLKYEPFIRHSAGYFNNALTVEFQNVVMAFRMSTSGECGTSTHWSFPMLPENSNDFPFPNIPSAHLILSLSAPVKTASFPVPLASLQTCPLPSSKCQINSVSALASFKAVRESALPL